MLAYLALRGRVRHPAGDPHVARRIVERSSMSGKAEQLQAYTLARWRNDD